MNKNLTFVLILILSTISSTFASDIDTLYNRYWEISINNPSKASVDELLALLNSDGSFSDINYPSATADLSAHLTRLKSFGGAYQTVGNAYYHNESLKTKFYTSLQYWITRNHTPSNWWFRHIAYPKEFGPCLFLMNVELKAEKPTLYTDAIDYLRWAFLQNNFMEGANGSDKIYAALPASILTKSDSQLKEYQDKIKALIAVQNVGEGIEADWMFGQHSRYGRQLYANYEQEYLNSMLTMLNLFYGTVYYVSNTETTILDNHFINGNQWYVYNNHTDPSQTGRFPTTSLNYRFNNNVKMLLGLNTPSYSQIVILQDRILNGKNAASKLIGNSMFWRFDYMIHRRVNYYVSSRLTSTRTVGMESGSGAGIYNYYGGSGLNFLFRTGYEYSGIYFTAMNYRQWPGITVEQDTASLPLVEGGKGGTNGNAFAGGVSDGFYGAIGTIYSKRNITAYKSWFYFDNEYVALGNGITESVGTASVFTTINQTIQGSPITYSKSKVQQTITLASGTTTVQNPDWVLQDSIGYINLLSTSNFKISSDFRGWYFFTVGIDHGVNPTNSTYAYVVYPNTSASFITSYKDSLPLQILSNTNTIQAVYHETLKITQAIFFTPGSLTLSDGKLLTVNAPCAVMIKDTNSTYQITVGNPLCETSNPASIILTMNVLLTGTNVEWNGTFSTIDIALPQGDYAGQSVRKIVYQKNCIPVFASSHDGNVPENTLDNDLNTRWSANGDGQYLRFCFGTSQVVNRVDIAFYLGDTRRSIFDVLVSEDGITWKNAAISLESSGKSNTLESFTFLPQSGKFVKIIGHGNSSDTWNSYTEVDFPSIISSSENNAKLIPQINISPNPVSDNLSISFANLELSSLRISIFNSLGVVVKLIENNELNENSSIIFSTETLPSGIYYCTLNIGTNKITKSFVIIK